MKVEEVSDDYSSKSNKMRKFAQLLPWLIKKIFIVELKLLFFRLSFLI